MRFAVDSTGQAIGAEEATPSEAYVCAGCGQPVTVVEGHCFQHADAASRHACAGDSIGLRLAAKQQMRICDRVRLPELSIIVTGQHRQREYVQVTEEKLFTPFGIELDSDLGEQTVDVLYEAGDWQLGFVLKDTTSPEIPFDISRMEGQRAGLISIDLGMIQLVSGTGVRSRREQLRSALSLGGGNKSWLYHPRSARLRRQTEERMERQWAFKNYMSNEGRQVAAGGNTGPRQGTPQRYRCSCGETFMGRAGISSLCPECRLPSGKYAVAIST